MNNLFIKSPRQKRALERLLTNSITVKKLGVLIGALNPCQIILELRKQGFKDIILTRRFDITDQDGKLCHPGEYYIPEDLKPFVREVLNRNSKFIIRNNKKGEQNARQ